MSALPPKADIQLRVSELWTCGGIRWISGRRRCTSAGLSAAPQVPTQSLGIATRSTTPPARTGAQISLCVHFGASRSLYDRRARPHGRAPGAAARLAFKVHPHMLRHACGYALANKGHDTRSLQAYLGHRNIQHTVRYTELSPTRFKDFWRN
jgi:integrase